MLGERRYLSARVICRRPPARKRAAHLLNEEQLPEVGRCCGSLTAELCPRGASLCPRTFQVCQEEAGRPFSPVDISVIRLLDNSSPFTTAADV